MAIVQISRIKHRRGNLIDLPSFLETGELGWTIDTRRLFIGNRSADGAPADENVEVLTSNTPSAGIFPVEEVLAVGAGSLVGDSTVIGGSFLDGVVFINYTLDNGTAYRSGTLKLISDGAAVSLEDNFIQQGGDLSAIVFAGTTTSTLMTVTYIGGNAETMKYTFSTWIV